MAFKILEKEELELLSDDQRKQYEKELNLYQQRVAFVEQLERLENVQIEPFEPKLESISVMDEIEPKVFRKTEYIVSLCEPVQKPDLQISHFQKMEQIMPVLPYVTKGADIRERHIRKIETEHPELPSIDKTEMVIKPFSCPEKTQASVPTVISPRIEMSITYGQLKDNLQQTPHDMPDITMPDIDIIPISVPVKTQPNLPDVPVSVAGVIMFHKPEKHDTGLPVIGRPYIEGNYPEKMEPIHPFLPEVVLNCHSVRADFHRPKQQSPELPTVAQTNVNVPVAPKTERVAPSLPRVPDVGTREKSFSKPEYPKPDLPTVPKLSIEEKLFGKTVNTTMDLPVFAETVFYERTFESLEKKEADITVPPTPDIVEKTFIKIERSTPGLPGINIAEAPDAYAVLKSLLIMADKN